MNTQNLHVQVVIRICKQRKVYGKTPIQGQGSVISCPSYQTRERLEALEFTKYLIKIQNILIVLFDFLADCNFIGITTFLYFSMLFTWLLISSTYVPNSAHLRCQCIGTVLGQFGHIIPTYQDEAFANTNTRDPSQTPWILRYLLFTKKFIFVPSCKIRKK